MKVFHNKLILTVALSAALVGCGGGGDSDDGGSSSGPNIPLVDGTMAYTNVTGKSFQWENTINESMASSSCEFSDSYFETDHVMAYSAAGATHSEADLQRVASTAEYAVKSLLGKFGIADMNELMALKRAVPYPFYESYAVNLIGMQDAEFNRIYLSDLSPYFAANVPDGYTGWDDPALQEDNKEQKFMRSLLVTNPNGAESAAIIFEMIQKAETDYGQDLALVSTELDESLIYDKIQVCVLGNEMQGAAEGHSIGFNIAANEEYSFYVHEGTHFIQKQYAEKFPRWMTEGQAVVFAGQNIASSKNSTDITTLLSFTDESLIGGNFYDHYGLAYKAMAKHNSVDAIIAFLQAYDLGAEWVVDYNIMEDPNLQMAKDAWTKTFPEWVSYEEFAGSYDTLAK